MDFGLYNRMNPEHVDFERHIMRAATEGRAQDMYDAMVARGIIDPQAGVSPKTAWSTAMRHLGGTSSTRT